MLEKTYDHKARELDLYNMWESSGAFRAQAKSDKPPYTIMMPPPNVTGNLHIGHALTFTLQDILVRYWRMKGNDVLWQPGTDHAGIATQMVVESQLRDQGIKRSDLSREDFIEKVWQWKNESGGTIVRQLRRLGASADWDRERFTLDEGLSEAVTKVFVQLYREGLIYKDKRLVNWDPKLQTAISDLEVEQRDVNGQMWYFKYPVSGETKLEVIVGTTRPETMFGDVAIAVHPSDERYTELVGRHCILPLIGREIPIVADDYADPEKGSGAVKITPAHDFNDFVVGQRHNLESITVMDAYACLNDNVPNRFSGLDRFEARKSVVKEMEALGLLDRIENNQMVVPYGDRSGVIVEPRLTDQWFADAKKLAAPAITAVEKGMTKFVPAQWENTYFEWMRNIQPWCVSRQLWWGHRIPAWYGPDGNFFVEKTMDLALSSAEKFYGKKVELKQDPDVLDTWFSSALWPFSTLGWPEKKSEIERYYPGNVLVTGFDIIFFWVARMMMMGLHFRGSVPFKEVYIHALVRDDKGQKMSKSKGNVMDPLDLCDKYGTDSVRFTLAAMAAQGRDIKLSEQRIAGYRNFITKIWNAAKFCEMNQCVYSEGFDPSRVSLALSRWIISKLAQTEKDIRLALEAYRFNDAAELLYHFTWHTYCDWFLEFAKPIFQGADETQSIELRETASWVRDQVLIIAHPIMPFVTEELWASTGIDRQKKLIVERWPEYRGLINTGSDTEIDWIVGLVSAIRSARAELNVPPSAKIEVKVRGMQQIHIDRLCANISLVTSNARLLKIDFVEQTPNIGGLVHVIFGKATLLLLLEGVVDLVKERQRLVKEQAKVDTDINKYLVKLNSENFLNKAPKNVISDVRRKKQVAEVEKKNLIAALKLIQ